jgi:hypothetical protein
LNGNLSFNDFVGILKKSDNFLPENWKNKAKHKLETGKHEIFICSLMHFSTCRSYFLSHFLTSPIDTSTNPVYNQTRTNNKRTYLAGAGFNTYQNDRQTKANAGAQKARI